MAAAADSTNVPWVEKYRPASIDAVSSQKACIQALQSAVSSGQLTHLLFYGPPGTGKTSTILALAHQLFGPEFKNRVLELNASDDRGIKVVREKVKQFARLAVSSRTASGHVCPPFRLVILDEADSMTSAAQAALRRTIEVHSGVTRFCLICNYVSRIIDPLKSRCAKFRFTPLPADAILTRLRYICTEEGFSSEAVPDAVLTALLEVSEGDMRKAITLLQSSVRLIAPGAPLTPRVVQDLAGVIPPNALDALWAAMGESKIAAATDAVNDLLAEGYIASGIVRRLHAKILGAESAALSDVRKGAICIKLAEVDSRLVQGCDPATQIIDCVAHAMRRMNGPSPVRAEDTKF